MNIRIESDFSFSVSSIQYTPNGEVQIILTSDEKKTDSRYQYTASLGSGYRKCEKKYCHFNINSYFCIEKR